MRGSFHTQEALHNEEELVDSIFEEERLLRSEMTVSKGMPRAWMLALSSLASLMSVSTKCLEWSGRPAMAPHRPPLLAWLPYRLIAGAVLRG